MGWTGRRPELALAGTALANNAFGNLLLRKDAPRSVDLWPIFHTGVPNLKPYQLATGKAGNPLADGKPFIHNFLPNGGDMLRLNMAVPPTPRNDPNFSNLGIVWAAVLGLTDPAYNASTALQPIPNMDGFPNGRRLEDDVVRIELQAVSGIALAAIGLWYDDYNCVGSPVTPDLLGVLNYTAGVTSNDVASKSSFPYVASPWPGTHNCDCANENISAQKNQSVGSMREVNKAATSKLNLGAPEMNLGAFPNPSTGSSTIKYSVAVPSHVSIVVYDLQGRKIDVLVDQKQDAGVYTLNWNNKNLAKGTYIVSALKNGMTKETVKVVKN